jgi:hypothetical protein
VLLEHTRIDRYSRKGALSVEDRLRMAGYGAKVAKNAPATFVVPSKVNVCLCVRHVTRCVVQTIELSYHIVGWRADMLLSQLAVELTRDDTPWSRDLTFCCEAAALCALTLTSSKHASAVELWRAVSTCARDALASVSSEQTTILLSASLVTPLSSWPARVDCLIRAFDFGSIDDKATILLVFNRRKDVDGVVARLRCSLCCVLA